MCHREETEGCTVCVQCTDTTKRDQQGCFSNQPSALQLDLVSTCHCTASSDRVSVRGLLQAKPPRSYMARACGVALRLSSDLPSCFSKPNAATCFHIFAWSRCFVPRSLGFSEPFCRVSRISFPVMCFWSHSVRVSKCLLLSTPLLAPDLVPCLGTSSSGQ